MEDTNISTQTQPTDDQAQQYAADTASMDKGSSLETPTPTDKPSEPMTAQTDDTNSHPSDVKTVDTQPQAQNQTPSPSDLQRQVMGLPSKAQQDVAQNPLPEENPAVKQASKMYKIAETLAGGQRYAYKVNVNTGEMEKTPVPVSGKQLGLAIALEALSGGLTGLAAGRGRGPGAAGAAALQQQMNRTQQVENQKRAEANADYIRGASIAKTNMEMLRNEQISSQADEEFQQRDVDRDSQLYQELSSIGGAVKQQGLTSDQVQALVSKGDANVTKDMFIGYKVVPVMKDGKQVRTVHGAPKYEKLYAQVDPNAVAHVDPKLWKEAQQYQLPGTVNANGDPIEPPKDLQMKVHMISNLRENIRKYSMNDDAVKGYENDQEHTLHSGTTPEAKSGTPAPRLDNPQMAEIADDVTDKYKLPDGLMHAIGLQEGGKPNTPNSKPNAKGVYAVGPFQVTLATAKNVTGDANLTEADLKDPKTNADISAHYLHNLLSANGGDVAKAVAGYFGHGTDSNGQTTSQYVSQVMSKMAQPATTETKTEGGESAPSITKVSDAIKEGVLSPKDIDTVQKMGGLATMLDGNHSVKDIQSSARAQKVDEDSVSRVLSVYGKNIDFRYDQRQQQLADIKTKNAIALTTGKKEAEDAAQQKLEDAAGAMLHVPENFHYDPNIMDMSIQDARKQLESQGVKVPDNFGDLFVIAKNNSHVTGMSPRVYKGVGGVPGISQSMGKTFIVNFLDPEWKEQNFEAKGKFLTDLNPRGTAGGVLFNGGVAAQHLDLAEKLMSQIDNTQSPIWNEAANTFGKKILGMAPAAVYDTIATQLANEVSKVTGGSNQSHVTDKEEIKKQLGNYQSPEQAKGNFEGLINLMAPRFEGIARDADTYHVKNEYRGKITGGTARVMFNHGVVMPGFEKAITDKQGNVIGLGETNPKTGKIVLQLPFDQPVPKQ